MKKVFVTLALMMIFITSSAQARIDILPHLLVIEGRERSAEMFVLNLSNEIRQFEIDLLNYKQKPDGAYEKLGATPLNSNFDPEKVVRMSPRSFTLGGNGKQKIRLSLRKPADLPEGEYRFHLKGISLKNTSSVEKDQEGNVAVQMDVNLALVIPVVVRHGNVNAVGRLSNFDLRASNTKSNKPELHFLATREGNASTLGKVTVSWAPTGSDDYEQIGLLTNFNVFTELDERNGRVILQKVPTSGQLKVTYSDTETKEIYDEIILDL